MVLTKSMATRFDRIIDGLNSIAERYEQLADITERRLRKKRRGVRVKGRARHLYVVEFTGYCVKVGITGEPLKRIASHAAEARKFGRDVGRVWVSFRHREARDNESALKGDAPTEYLARGFEDVLDQALSLPMTRVEVSRGRS